MNKLFIPFEFAEKLAKLGFDLPCFGFYHPSLVNSDVMLTTALDYTWDSSEYCTNTNLKTKAIQPQIAAPLYDQVIDWFREKHSYHVFINRESVCWQVNIQHLRDDNFNGYCDIDLPGEIWFEDNRIAKIASLEYICQILETKSDEDFYDEWD